MISRIQLSDEGITRLDDPSINAVANYTVAIWVVGGNVFLANSLDDPMDEAYPAPGVPWSERVSARFGEGVFAYSDGDGAVVVVKQKED